MGAPAASGPGATSGTLDGRGSPRAIAKLGRTRARPPERTSSVCGPPCITTTSISCGARTARSVSSSRSRRNAAGSAAASSTSAAAEAPSTRTSSRSARPGAPRAPTRTSVGPAKLIARGRAASISNQRDALRGRSGSASSHRKRAHPIRSPVPSSETSTRCFPIGTPAAHPRSRPAHGTLRLSIRTSTLHEAPTRGPGLAPRPAGSAEGTGFDATPAASADGTGFDGAPASGPVSSGVHACSTRRRDAFAGATRSTSRSSPSRIVASSGASRYARRTRSASDAATLGSRPFRSTHA